MERTFELKLRFLGKKVDRSGLDFYDGSVSFHGFAKSLQTVTHAFVNNEVRSRSTTLKGASLRFGSIEKGSIVFRIFAHIFQKPKKYPLSPDAFYDFVRVAMERATGNESSQAQTSFVKNELETGEIFDAISEKIEGSLQQAHRSIDQESIKVSLERPRSALVMFDAITSSWVNVRTIDLDVQDFFGNMTRYNTQTGNGRAYIKSVGRIIPIRKSQSFKKTSNALLTWSLHGSNVDTESRLRFSGRKVESSSGVTKRLIIDDCYKA